MYFRRVVTLRALYEHERWLKKYQRKRRKHVMSLLCLLHAEFPHRTLTELRHQVDSILGR